MKKIAFYLDNAAIASTDCSKALESNPGIGGTEWLIIAISTLLSERDNGLDITLFTTSQANLPVGLKNVIVKDLSEAIVVADSAKVDYLVVKHLAENIVNHTFDVRTEHLRIICWCHVFVCHWELDHYADNEIITKVVFVGREMFDLYRDHRIYSKTTYIYNCVPSGNARECVRLNPYGTRNNVIVYVGSLVPFKGFHLLAEAWPKVKMQIPDAELFVIGSGKLYNKNSLLGEWQIADAEYEDRFMPYLLSNGKLHPDVHFMGVMGEEKKDVLLRSRIGVPNPSGITETFCLSAVEMQMYGCRIATNNYPGYLDTVRNGKLFDRKGNLADLIIDLLKSTDSNYEEAMDYFESEFSYDTVCSKWEELLTTGNLHYSKKLRNPFYRFKWLKEFMRIIKQYVPILSHLQMVERFLIFFERKLYGRVTYIDS